ncbi:MAG: hypothetical protein J7621_20190 [Niastella sp.]|nr:hypothetical protein [Niastella sp.]
MSANVQHILLNLEAAPPPGAWETISTRLDTEFDASESKIAEKLYDWETPPPSAAWDHIALALQITPAPQEAPAKVIRLPFRKVAIAAAVLAIVGFLTWNFLNSAPDNTNIVQRTQEPTTPNNNTPNNDVQVQPSLPAIDASIGGRRRTTINVARRVNVTEALNTNYVSNTMPEIDPMDDIQHAEIDGLRAQVTTARNGIKAPLIKDANGNVIMDKSLIITRDNNYIIITCPNGEQTRISAKFLPVLTDLNAATDPAEYFDAVIRENNIWKSRFSQWRAKLMQQASFAPTANNFLDILTLKELIAEQ